MSSEQQKLREFYIPPEPTDNEDEIFNSGISSGINFDKYEHIPIRINGENVPKSIESFEDADLHEILLTNIKRSGYKLPTPIQKAAISIINNGRDLMGCAQTGSGKTAAYLIPIINVLLKSNSKSGIGRPNALIVAPTRELAIQIRNEARKFALGSHLTSRVLYGGTSTKHQYELIAKGGPSILISTPGRLLDFVGRAYISFDNIQFVVLDEADRMLDMGFKDDVNTIMNHSSMPLKEERQNLLFSATFPSAVQNLAGTFLNNYIFIAVGLIGGACADVTQVVYQVEKMFKKDKLMEILNESSDGTIIFVETKRGADFLASYLSDQNVPTTTIHGDRLQSQREMALKDFKCGKMKVLIATSVAARGLDIKTVCHVINYDLPRSIDEYVHRIGRTGRLGNKGRATSFYDPKYNSGIVFDLVKTLKDADQEIPDFLAHINDNEITNDFQSNNHFRCRDIRKHNSHKESEEVSEEEEEYWN